MILPADKAAKEQDMQGADLSSLVLGAVLGFVASISGLWFRRNWERFDHEQTRCRQELIELARNCELARIAVRQTRAREHAIEGAQPIDGNREELLKSYAQAGETIYEVTSRIRRLKPGELRSACAGYMYLLEAFAWKMERAPSTIELDGAALKVQVLIQAAAERVDTRRARIFALRGSTLTCPPIPYSESLPASHSAFPVAARTPARPTELLRDRIDIFPR